MKVLLCSPLGGVAGGISRWTERMLRFYNSLSDKTVLLDHFNTARKHYVDFDGAILKRCYWGAYDSIEQFRQFRKQLKKDEYDIVHITSSGSLGMLSLLRNLQIAKKSGSKTVVHFRFGRIPDLFKKKNWEYKLLLKVIKSADAVIVLDKKTLDAICSTGHKRVFLCPNPISNENIEIIDSLSIERKPGKIVFAGHVIPSKGVMELLYACTSLDKIDVDIVGWCPQQMCETITAYLDRHHLGNKVHMLGQLTSVETLKKMKEAEIFVLPSYTEGFPNVISEAMACACPIIATNVGAIPEMLEFGGERQCGEVIKPKNGEALSTAIKSLQSDEKRRLRYSQLAKEKALREYTMISVWQQLCGIWGKTIS